MKRALLALIVVAAGSFGSLAYVLTTSGQQGEVIDSAHDLGTQGSSACEQCHIPQNAYAEPLWANAPNRAHPSGLASAVGALCYSCHDGTATERGVYVFDDSRGQHPIESGELGKDCDMCHDPHTPKYGFFLLFPSGANLCRSCHALGDPGHHPLDVAVTGDGYPPDTSWDPNAGDFTGTPLWDAAGTAPGNQVKCLSCHTAHGGAAGTPLNTVPYRDATSARSPLCLSCHR